MLILYVVVAVLLFTPKTKIKCTSGPAFGNVTSYPSAHYVGGRVLLVCGTEIFSYNAVTTIEECSLRPMNAPLQFNKVTVAGLDTEVTILCWGNGALYWHDVSIDNTSQQGCQLYTSGHAVIPTGVVPVPGSKTFFAYEPGNPPTITRNKFISSTNAIITTWTHSSDFLAGIEDAVDGIVIDGENVFIWTRTGSSQCTIFYALGTTSANPKIMKKNFDTACYDIMDNSPLLEQKKVAGVLFRIAVLSELSVLLCTIKDSGDMSCVGFLYTWDIQAAINNMALHNLPTEETAKIASIESGKIYMQVLNEIFLLEFHRSSLKSISEYNVGGYTFVGYMNPASGFDAPGVIYGVASHQNVVTLWSSDGNFTDASTAAPLAVVPTDIPTSIPETFQPTTGIPTTRIPTLSPTMQPPADETQQPSAEPTLRPTASRNQTADIFVVVIATSVGLLFLLSVCVCGCFIYRRLRSKQFISIENEVPLLPILSEPDDEAIRRDIPWDEFSNIEDVARGNFGNVFKAYYKASHEVVALKKNRCGNLDEFRKEMLSLCSFRQKDIIQFYGWTENKSGFVFMVTEYCDNGSLRHACRRDGGSKYFTKLSGIASAISYIHNRGMCHLDIAARNIVIDANNHLKLADMGLMREVGESLPKCLPVAWCPPEALHHRAVLAKAEHDIWSFGCVAYEVLTGLSPFYDVSGTGSERLREITRRVVSGQIPLMKYSSSDDDLLSTAQELLMIPCWKYRSEERMTISDIANLFRRLAPHFDSSGVKITTSLREAFSLSPNITLNSSSMRGSEEELRLVETLYRSYDTPPGRDFDLELNQSSVYTSLFNDYALYNTEGSIVAVDHMYSIYSDGVILHAE